MELRQRILAATDRVMIMALIVLLLGSGLCFGGAVWWFPPALAIVAFLIALVYIWVPGPYPMGAFTFIAQPLFLLALISYTIKVLRELRGEV